MLPRDPEILLSVVNTKLRDEYSSFERLCDALDESESELTEILKSAGYTYQEATNQFH